MAWFAHVPLVLAQAGAQGASLDDELSLGLKFAIALGVVIGSFVLGSLLARALRMPDYGFKLGVVLCSLLAGVVVCVLGWPPKLGIDLSGGVVLVYEVDTEQQTSDNLREIVADINKGASAGKIKARANEKNQIEIFVPQGVSTATAADRVKASLPQGVELESAGERTENGQDVLVYRLVGERKAVDMSELVGSVSKRINPGGVKEVTVRQYGREQIEIIIPEVEEREVERIKEKISKSGFLEFRILANEQDHKREIALARDAVGHDVYDGPRLVARWVKTKPDPGMLQRAIARTTDQEPEALVIIDSFNIEGRDLSRRSVGIDNRGGPCVNFSFYSRGATLFGQLTGNNLPDPATGFARQLGIILDGVLLSAPNIQSTITNDGQITGSFTKEEVQDLVDILNAGSLPAALRSKPISEQQISSQLGEDTIRSGTSAMLYSTLAILVFMAVYYRFSGLIANLAVVVNIVITVALMILIKAAFSLPGLAGLVLTVGMAVDANVLIYERMREELAKGTSLRMAIRNGFSRAMATIIDSNLTTIFTAIVLFAIGTDQIKGFSVTLFLGLLVSMYTAIFVSRVIFDIVEKKRWLTRLKMMQLIGRTEIDFIGLRTPAVIASLAVILIGTVGVFSRGADLFDIDFTGGSSVTMLLDKDKPYDIAKVRELVSDLPDVAVSSIGKDNLEFMINTSNRDVKEVQAKLKAAFGDDLRTYSMSHGKLARIDAKKDDVKKDEDAGKRGEGEKDEKKPTSTDGASRRIGAEPLLAAAAAGLDGSLAALLFTQAEEPDAKATTKPDEPAKTETPAKPDAPAKTATPVAVPAPAEAAEKTQTPAPPTTSVQPTQTDSFDATYAGGTRVTLNFPQPIQQVTLEGIIQEEIDAAGHKSIRFHLSPSDNKPVGSAPLSDWSLALTLAPDQTEQLLVRIEKRLAAAPVFPSSSEIGGKVADDAQQLAAVAMVASWVIIILYVWIRFQSLVFGVAAVVALIHDVLVTVGFLALSAYVAPYLGFALVDPFKISLAVVAALLTIIGFSINDTIVIFDRIREVRGKSPDLTPEMINLSVNQTLSRTMLTSGTVLIASVILYLIGGQGIHAFAFAMVVGVIAGTYSSVYIAAPIVLWMKKPAPVRETVGVR